MCKGLYADVNKKAEFQQMDQIENVRETVARYEDYKRGFQEDIIKYYEYVFTSMFQFYKFIIPTDLFRL